MDEQPKDPDALNVLVLERVDRTKNMARYYVLSVEPTLFAESSLVRLWCMDTLTPSREVIVLEVR